MTGMAAWIDFEGRYAGLLRSSRVAGARAGDTAGRGFSGAFNRHSSKLGDSLRRTLGRAALAGTAVVGAGVAAGFVASVNAASTFEKRMSAVGAVSNATAAEMAQLRQKALDLGRDTKYSASEAASAMEELVKAGVAVPDVVNGAADAVVALAAAGEVELPEAAAIAANAMNQFNLTAEQTSKVADLIAGSANASAIDVSDFGMSMAQAGAVANLVGLSFDDTAVAITAMGNAGIKGSDAGTSLKTMLMRLTPTTEGQAKAMRELGIITEDGTNQFYDAQGNVKSLADVAGVLEGALAGMSAEQRQATLTTLFGSDAIRAAAVIAEEGADGIASLTTEIGKISAEDVAEKRMDNLAGSIEKFKGSLDTLLITTGSPFLGFLRGIVDWATRGLNLLASPPAGLTDWLGNFRSLFDLFANGEQTSLRFAAWFDRILGGTGRTVVPLAHLYDAFARLFEIGRTVVGWISDNLAPVLAGLAGAAAALLAPVALGGIAAVLGGIVAVIASPITWVGLLAGAFYAAYTRSEEFRARVDNLAGALRRGLGRALEWLTGTAVPAVTGAFTDLVTGFRGGGADGIFGPVGRSLRTAFDWIVGTAIPGIRSAVSSFVDGLKGEGGEGSFFTDLAEGAVTAARWFTRTVLPAAQRLFGWLTSDGKPVLIALGVAFAALVSPIGTAVAAFVFAYQKFSWFRTGVAAVLGAIRGYFEHFWVPTFVMAWNAVRTYLGYAIGWWQTVLLPIIGRVITAVRWYFTNVWMPAFRVAWDVVSTYLGLVRTYITTVLLPVLQRIWDVVVTVFNGVRTAISAAWAFVSPILAAVVGYIRDHLEWRFNVLRTVVETVWGAVSSAVSGAWGFIRPILEAVVGFIRDTVVPVWAGIADAVSSAFGRIPDIIGGALRRAGNLVSGFLRAAAGIADAVGLDAIADGLRRAAGSANSWGEASSSYSGGSGGGGGPLRQMAEGGRVTGGIPGRDSVPILAMPGEYVLTPAMTREAGVGNLENWRRRSNGGRPTSAAMPRFAEGGLVGVAGDIWNATGGRVIDKLRDIGAGAVERVWPELDVPAGLLGIGPGGHNHVRSRAIDVIRGEADKRLKAEEAKEQATRGGGLPGSTTGLNPEFLRRFNAYSAAVGGLTIVSGFRSYAQQAALYAKYLRGEGNLAAPPGRSNHERGLAIDHAPHSTAAMREIARGFRLHYPVRGEPWHVEPFAEGGLITLHRRPADTITELQPGWNLVKNMTGGKEVVANTDLGGRGPLVGTVHVHDDADIDHLLQGLSARTRLRSL